MAERGNGRIVVTSSNSGFFCAGTCVPSATGPEIGAHIVEVVLGVGLGLMRLSDSAPLGVVSCRWQESGH